MLNSWSSIQPYQLCLSSAEYVLLVDRYEFSCENLILFDLLTQQRQFIWEPSNNSTFRTGNMYAVVK
jgi:hypothetical protein